MDKRSLYSKIPKVDTIIEDERIVALIEYSSRVIVMESIREELETIRAMISSDESYESIEAAMDSIVKRVIDKSKKKFDNHFKRAINGTGIVIHTNLGRSLINESVMKTAMEVGANYSNLELDLETGERGSRYSHVTELIKRITGAEDALVVNNNAAAVVLALSAIASGKEVITSRGELVEIGGSFRIPEVMEQSGAKLVDVGATNKTKLSDYSEAITEFTGALLKVHTSNFRILGFTESLSLDEIVGLGRSAHIPVIEDLGSGVLVDLSKYGLEYEPTVQESVKSGVDVITFSGDKLLGGPQAGIIIGKSKYIEKMKKHPLNRAFRIDKFTIAILEGTLKYYLDEADAVENIPTLKLLTQSIDTLDKRADAVIEKLSSLETVDFDFKKVDGFSQVGGGSMPLERIPTKSVRISTDKESIASLERKLRALELPIISRLYKDNLYIDLRTVRDYEIEELVNGVAEAIANF